MAKGGERRSAAKAAVDVMKLNSALVKRGQRYASQYPKATKVGHKTKRK